MWSNFRKLFALKPVFYNTLILCSIWATSTFTFYFVEFYTKFVPTTNIYLLQVVIGSADLISSFVYYFCLSLMKSYKNVLVVTFVLMTLASLSLYLSVALTGYADFELGVTEISLQLSLIFSGLVFLLRCSATIAFAMSYYLNVALTPPELNASVFALTNITTRTLLTFTPLVADTVSNPSIIVVVMAIITLSSSFFINENTRLLT